MIKIDELALQLPQGFEHRARPIVQLVADALSRFEPGEAFSLARLSLPPIQITPNASNQQIATQISHAITSSLQKNK